MIPTIRLRHHRILTTPIKLITIGLVVSAFFLCLTTGDGSFFDREIGRVARISRCSHIFGCRLWSKKTRRLMPEHKHFSVLN